MIFFSSYFSLQYSTIIRHGNSQLRANRGTINLIISGIHNKGAPIEEYNFHIIDQRREYRYEIMIGNIYTTKGASRGMISILITKGSMGNHDRNINILWFLFLLYSEASTNLELELNNVDNPLLTLPTELKKMHQLTLQSCFTS